MNITEQKLNNVSLRLTVNVEENDYKAKVVEDLKKIGRTHTIPGFRKGHISVADLQRRFGRQVTSDVINQVVYEAVMKYIEDNKLNVLGAPVPVEIKELDLKNQKDFTFEYDLGLAPQLDIKLDKSIKLPFYEIEVSDEMIDEQDKAFRKRFGQQGPGEQFEEDALVKGVLVELNADGTQREGDDAIRVEAGIVAPFYFKDKDEAAKFNGSKVGDKVVFNPARAAQGDEAELSSMLNIDRARVASVTNDFELTISEIIVVKPAELGEELYTNTFGKDRVHNEEEYRAAIKSMIAGELRGNSEALFQFAAKKALLDKFGEMELPDEILKKWLLTRSDELTPENIDENYNHMRNDLKWQLIREKIAELTNLKIEEADLLMIAKGIAARQFAQYGMTNLPEETIEKYAKDILADEKFRPRIVEQAGDVKLYEAIRNAVDLDDKKVSLDEFKEIASKI